MPVGIFSVGQRHRSIVEIEDVAALSRDAALQKTEDVSTDVPNWGFVVYCARYGRLLDVCRLTEMFSDGQSKTMIGLRGICHDTNIGAWDHRWALMRE